MLDFHRLVTNHPISIRIGSFFRSNADQLIQTLEHPSSFDHVGKRVKPACINTDAKQTTMLISLLFCVLATPDTLPVFDNRFGRWIARRLPYVLDAHRCSRASH